MRRPLNTRWELCSLAAVHFLKTSMAARWGMSSCRGAVFSAQKRIYWTVKLVRKQPPLRSLTWHLRSVRLLLWTRYKGSSRNLRLLSFHESALPLWFVSSHALEVKRLSCWSNTWPNWSSHHHHSDWIYGDEIRSRYNRLWAPLLKALIE